MRARANLRSVQIFLDQTLSLSAFVAHDVSGKGSRSRGRRRADQLGISANKRPNWRSGFAKFAETLSPLAGRQDSALLSDR